MSQRRIDILSRVCTLFLFVVVSLQIESILLGRSGLITLTLEQCLLCWAHPWLLSISALIAFSVFSLVFGFWHNKQYQWFAFYVLFIMIVMLTTVLIGLILFGMIYQIETPLIWPWQVYPYYLALQAHSSIQAQLLFAVFAGPASVLIGIMLYIAYQSDTSRKPFGCAHSANAFEIFNAGFYQAKGILLGKKLGGFLYSGGYEHVMVFAPSGSGKTSAIAIPNLFTWSGSVVVNDVKGTLYQTTSKYRQDKLGNECYVWAPASLKTHRYNPLSFISSDKIERVKDIQRIAHIFIPNKKGDIFWSQSSRELFTALVLYFLDSNEQSATLGKINRLVKQQDFDSWLEDKLYHSTNYDAVFYQNGFAYLNTDERTRSNILKSFVGYFELFDDPIVDAATTASDFDILQLRQKKISLYITFNDDDMDRLSPIITVFWQQMISKMIAQVPSISNEPHDVLCVIDEFSSMGRLETLRTSLKLLREYRVRCIIMVQYIAQTFEQYSHDEAKAFLNIKTKVAFTPDNIDDAKYISDALGQTTQRIQTTSNSWQVDLGGGSQTLNYQYQAIPLMRPEEVLKIKPGKAIIMKTGCQPIMSTQCIWYQESRFKLLALGSIALPEQNPVVFHFNHEAKGDSSDNARLSPQTFGLSRRLLANNYVAREPLNKRD